jgi:ABC-type antimicrobial peptide transport system permease subunit
MGDRVESSLGPARFSLGLFSMAAVIAIALAAVGLYALLSFSVAQRQQEMGVRMALGAERKELLALVVRQSLRLVSIGLFVGVLTALAGVRSLESLLYGVPAYDPLTFATVVASLLLIAFLATLLPAFRATRVDPVNALRDE